jgi:hypothetical protein
MGSPGVETKNDCAGEAPQQFTTQRAREKIMMKNIKT